MSTRTPHRNQITGTMQVGHAYRKPHSTLDDLAKAADRQRSNDAARSLKLAFDLDALFTPAMSAETSTEIHAVLDQIMDIDAYIGASFEQEHRFSDRLVEPAELASSILAVAHALKARAAALTGTDNRVANLAAYVGHAFRPDLEDGISYCAVCAHPVTPTVDMCRGCVQEARSRGEF